MKTNDDSRYKQNIMNGIDLVLVDETDNCTLYTIQFQSESETEFERFYRKFKDDAVYNPDLMRIVAFINGMSSERRAMLA